MILVGVKSGDLPGALTMLADYFQRQSSIWMRLKSMMVYPLIVMFIAFLISAGLAFLWTCVIGPSMGKVFGGMGVRLPAATIFAFSTLKVIWVFPVGARFHVFDCGVSCFYAGAARKISLVAARVQGGRRLADRGVANLAAEKTASTFRTPSAWWNNLKPAPPLPPTCISGGKISPPEPRSFPRSPPSTG